MKVENRVEALEHELKILKNEIQSTLLEIRDQILVHYYPELRAEEPVKGKPVGVKQLEAALRNEGQTRNGGSVRRKATERNGQFEVAEKPANVQPFSDAFLQDLGLEDDFDEFDTGMNMRRGLEDEEMEGAENDDASPSIYSHSTVPKTREVVLQQLKQARTDHKPKARGAEVDRESQSPRPNRRNFAALATWVGDSIAKVGKERTVQVVETYAASGSNLMPETKTSLLQLIALASDAKPTSPAGNQETLGIMVALDQILGES